MVALIEKYCTEFAELLEQNHQRFARALKKKDPFSAWRVEELSSPIKLKMMDAMHLLKSHGLIRSTDLAPLQGIDITMQFTIGSEQEFVYGLRITGVTKSTGISGEACPWSLSWMTARRNPPPLRGIKG